MAELENKIRPYGTQKVHCPDTLYINYLGMDATK
jgi:hypothetical protein